MLHRIGQYLALNRTDRQALRRAFTWLVIADLVLRVRRFQYLDRWLDAPAEGSVDAHALRRAEQYAHWLDVAARHHFVHARCLHRSLVLQHWLRREGLPSRLRIGVRTEGRVLHAHAWVDLGGYTVHDSIAAVAPFTPLARPDPRLGRWTGVGAPGTIAAARRGSLQRHTQETGV